MAEKTTCPHCNGTGQMETHWACAVGESPRIFCVLDFDRPQDCIYAVPGGVRADCEYWQQVKVDDHD